MRAHLNVDPLRPKALAPLDGWVWTHMSDPERCEWCGSPSESPDWWWWKWRRPCIIGATKWNSHQWGQNGVAWPPAPSPSTSPAQGVKPRSSFSSKLGDGQWPSYTLFDKWHTTFSRLIIVFCLTCVCAAFMVGFLFSDIRIPCHKMVFWLNSKT